MGNTKGRRRRTLRIFALTLKTKKKSDEDSHFVVVVVVDMSSSSQIRRFAAFNLATFYTVHT